MRPIARFVHLTLCLAFACLLDAHLPVLQVVAWTGMLVRYSQDRSIVEAVQMTFDGEHPCAMCAAIKKERQAPPTNLEPFHLIARLLLFLHKPVEWRPVLMPIDSLFEAKLFLPELPTLPELKPPRARA